MHFAKSLWLELDKVEDLELELVLELEMVLELLEQELEQKLELDWHK